MKSFYKVSITAVTYNRLTHLLSGNSILAVIHSLKIFVGIEFFSYAEFFRPCHVVCPCIYPTSVRAATLFGEVASTSFVYSSL